MADIKKTKSRINAAFVTQFGRNATKGELDYYLKPGRIDKLDQNLAQDTAHLRPELQGPQDLLSIYKQAFGDQVGQALYTSLQAPTPQTNEQLKAGFDEQFNPYFQQLETEYGTQFGVDNTRSQEDLNAALGQVDTQANQSAQDFATWQQRQQQQETVNGQNATGQYNQQYDEAFGSPMQLQQEALRRQQYQQGMDQGQLQQTRTQEEAQRQRSLLQQNFQRRNYDLSTLNTQNLRNLGYQKETALADYANQNRINEVL